MKILYITDLHGNYTKYRQTLKLAKDNKVDMVINGGDMLPKNIDLMRQGEFVDGFLDDYFKELNDNKIYHLGLLGNDDLAIFDEAFARICDKYKYVDDVAQKKVKINGYEFIGFNLVPDYPFRLKDRCRKDNDNFIFDRQLGSGLFSTRNGWKTIRNWMSYANGLPTIAYELKRLPKPSNKKKAVYIIHSPPSGVRLGIIEDGKDVGSSSVTNFIAKNQPKMVLSGHIHCNYHMTKGVWHNNIYKTVCIQPGQEKKLPYVLIDLDKMEYSRNLI